MPDTTDDPAEQIRREWTLRSYPTLARQIFPLAAELVDAAGVGPDDRVLDVACGTGNVTLTAHRHGAVVTGVDIAPAMLGRAGERAAALHADVVWREGNAEALPFDDDTFDVTLSCLGHVFARDPGATGAELLRVTRPGGRIAYTAWTGASAVAALFDVLSTYLPAVDNPPPSPVLWADEPTVRDRIGDAVTDLTFRTGTLTDGAISPDHFWAHLRRDSGAMILAVDALDPTAIERVEVEVHEALEPFFDASTNAMRLEYRVVTAALA